jgi:phosphoribosylanthranilate isomerase
MNARTVVKVCGITRLEDARVALEAGADWLGFIVKHDGPRAIDVERARAIAEAIDGATTVAVMVAPEPEEALMLARRMRARRVQLHNVDATRWPVDFPLPITIAVPVASDGSLTAPLPRDLHTVMLDTAHGTLVGGTGRAFPWETARVVAATRPVVLAGGLGEDNVADAIAAVHPFGVDASSRLEVSPGIKDHDLVRRFVAEVRRYDEHHGTAA